MTLHLCLDQKVHVMQGCNLCHGWQKYSFLEGMGLTSKNLGAIIAVPVTLEDTSLLCIEQIEIAHYQTYIHLLYTDCIAAIYTLHRTAA